jgi:hypothetical protein
VVSNRTPYITLIGDCFAGSAIGGVFWMCEQAARTCSTVAVGVLGLNWTVIHCWLSAASIFAQPESVATSTAAAAAGTAIQVLPGRRRTRTPTLYGLLPDWWLTGPSRPYGDVDGDDDVDDVEWRLGWPV